MTGGISSGTLPGGISYGNALSNVGGEGVKLGSGYLYMMPTANLTAMPSDSVIEIDANNVGIIAGGFKVNAKPKLVSVENQFGQTVANFVIKEEFITKTGLATWRMENFSNLSTAVTYTTSSDVRSVWTGTTNKLPKVLVRFVSEVQPDGSIIRFTMVGQGGKGFGLDFGTKEWTVDAELEAIAMFENFMAEFRMTLPTPVQSDAIEEAPTPKDTVEQAEVKLLENK